MDLGRDSDTILEIVVGVTQLYKIDLQTDSTYKHNVRSYFIRCETL